MTENAIVLHNDNSLIRTMDDAERAAKAMAASGFFQDSRDAAQAVVKIMAGREMGFGPFAAMTGVYIIQGRPSIGANLMAAAVKKSGRYDYRVVEMTGEKCSIDFFQGKDALGRSTFTLDDAKKAGTKNIDKFARNMLFARAMSNGCRWYCPDVFNGAAVYTPEELGANVNEDGDVIESTFTATPPTEPSAPLPTTQHAPDPEPEERHVDEYDSAIVSRIAAEVKQPAPRIKNALAYCSLDKSVGYDELILWINRYRDARTSGMTPAEAGGEANASN